MLSWDLEPINKRGLTTLILLIADLFKNFRHGERWKGGCCLLMVVLIQKELAYLKL